MFRERFGSRVQLHRDEYRIEVNYTHGPFRYLVNRWRFRERTDGCEVDFFVDFEFRSRQAAWDVSSSGSWAGSSPMR